MKYCQAPRPARVAAAECSHVSLHPEDGLVTDTLKTAASDRLSSVFIPCYLFIYHVKWSQA